MTHVLSIPGLKSRRPCKGGFSFLCSYVPEPSFEDGEDVDLVDHSDVNFHRKGVVVSSQGRSITISVKYTTEEQLDEDTDELPM